MGDDILVKDGKVVWESATGDIATTPSLGSASDCACCQTCDPAAVTCGNCDDVTPQGYTLTVSGVTFCTTCSEITTDWFTVQSGTINGSYTLDIATPADGDACTWGFESVGGITIDTYLSESDCDDGTVDSTYDGDIRILLTKNATTWDLSITYILDLGSGVTQEVQAFCGSATATTSGSDQVCASVPSISNNLTTCGDTTSGTGCDFIFDTFTVATGGSATATCTEA